MIEAGEKIIRFTDGMTYEEFVADERTVDAALRNFGVMGVGTKNLPPDITQEYEDIPWTEMAGMRDRLIHGCATVDLEIVWTTIEGDLPEILPKLRSILDDLDQDSIE